MCTYDYHHQHSLSVISSFIMFHLLSFMSSTYSLFFFIKHCCSYSFHQIHNFISKTPFLKFQPAMISAFSQKWFDSLWWSSLFDWLFFIRNSSLMMKIFHHRSFQCLPWFIHHTYILMMINQDNDFHDYHD